MVDTAINCGGECPLRQWGCGLTVELLLALPQQRIGIGKDVVKHVGLGLACLGADRRGVLCQGVEVGVGFGQGHNLVLQC